MSKVFSNLLAFLLVIGILAYLLEETKAPESPVPPSENEIKTKNPEFLPESLPVKIQEYPENAAPEHPVPGTRVERGVPAEFPESTPGNRFQELDYLAPMPISPSMGMSGEMTSRRENEKGNPGEISKLIVLNLQTALNAEANAAEKYKVYAEKARESGYHGLAALFRASAFSDHVRAKRYEHILESLGADVRVEMKTFVGAPPGEMLREAINSETLKFTDMYPGFTKDAEKDTASGNRRHEILSAYQDSMAGEMRHVKFFVEALGDLENWKKSEKTFSVCGNCGLTKEGRAEGNCSACGASPDNSRLFLHPDP